MNLEEDLAEAMSLEVSLSKKIYEIKRLEVDGHKELQRQEEEIVKMLRSDIGSDILDNKIPDAIEMPFVSDSESEVGSAADSDLDVLDVSHVESGSDPDSQEHNEGDSDRT